MITPIEVLDTAVKIGLGALISGAAGYWLARLNHDREMEKERARRRREMLEDIAEKVQKFTHLALRYWAFVANIADDERQGVNIEESRYSKILKARAELFDAFGELTSAEAKLLLLGESDCQKMIREYGEYVTDFRAEPHVKNQKFTEEYLQEVRGTVLNKREAFFKILCVSYKQRRI